MSTLFQGKRLGSAAVIENSSWQDDFQVTSSYDANRNNQFLLINGTGGSVAILFESGAFAVSASNYANLPFGSIVSSPSDGAIYVKTGAVGTATFKSCSLA